MKIEKPTAFLTGLMILAPAASSYCSVPPPIPTDYQEAFFTSFSINSKTLGCAPVTNQQEDPPNPNYLRGPSKGTSNLIGTASLPSNASIAHFTIGTAQFTLNQV